MLKFRVDNYKYITETKTMFSETLFPKWSILYVQLNKHMHAFTLSRNILSFSVGSRVAFYHIFCVMCS